MKVLNRKSIIFIVIGVVCAVILLLMGGKEEKSVQDETAASDHEEEVEQKLTDLISRLDGVSDVKVAVSMECGTEYIYAVNSEISENSQRTEYYSIGDEPLLIKEVMPKVKGVGVVCKGGDNITVKTKIIQLVTSVLDISSNRIFVGS